MAAPTAADVDALYGLPPTEFTAARKALVERLREAGRSDDALELAARRKPTAVLWGINQLARRHRDEVDAFLAAVERLRRAQSRGAEGLAEATAAERRARDALARRARDLLAGSGARATPATARSVANTLLGAAADRERAAQLRRGALDAELPAPGFDAWLGGGSPGLRVVGGREHRSLGGRADAATPRPARGPARSARAPARSVRATGEPRAPSAAASLAAARRERAAVEAREAIVQQRQQLEERQRTLADAEREARAAAEAADRLRAHAEEARMTAQRLAREAAAAHAQRIRAGRRAAEAQRAVRDSEQALERARRGAGSQRDD